MILQFPLNFMSINDHKVIVILNEVNNAVKLLGL